MPKIERIMPYALVPEEDPVEGWNMLYKLVFKDLNISVIGVCDGKKLTY